jgi:hypothetical protein
MSEIWYSLCWKSNDGAVWYEDLSFSTVGDAKRHAAEHAPDGATHYRINNIGGDHVIERVLDAGAARS